MKRSGFCLPEMLVTVVWFSIVLTLLVGLAWSVFRVQGAATKSFDAMMTKADLADRFRADVAQATDSPELARDFQASPLCLILRGKDDPIVLYRFVDGRLERVEVSDSGSRIEPFRLEGVEGEFGRHGKTLTLTLRDAQGRTLPISAALEGGRR